MFITLCLSGDIKVLICQMVFAKLRVGSVLAKVLYVPANVYDFLFFSSATGSEFQQSNYIGIQIRAYKNFLTTFFPSSIV